jgi:hypothetical protein
MQVEESDMKSDLVELDRFSLSGVDSCCNANTSRSNA